MLPTYAFASAPVDQCLAPGFVLSTPYIFGASIQDNGCASVNLFMVRRRNCTDLKLKRLFPGAGLNAAQAHGLVAQPNISRRVSSPDVQHGHWDRKGIY